MTVSAAKTSGAKAARSITKTAGHAKSRELSKSIPKPPNVEKVRVARPPSKQSKVLLMLRGSKGATIAAITKATGWKPHSVRGFLAGVVRKKLKLPLTSAVVGDSRIYRIAQKAPTKP